MRVSTLESPGREVSQYVPQKWTLEIPLLLEKKWVINLFTWKPMITMKQISFQTVPLDNKASWDVLFILCFLCLQEKDVMITPMPFARPQDLGPSIAIVAKVNQIQDHLLKKHDIELYMHLNRLEIAPQIYGM